MIDEFRRFCKIDLQLTDAAAYNHIRYVKALKTFVNKHLESVSRDDIREFLTKYNGMSPYTYCNALKSMKVFFRDFMKKKELVETFQFPKIPLQLKTVPTKEQLQLFYNTLKSPRDKALFLMYVTTGLRRSEVLSLRLKDVDLEKRMAISQIQSSRTKLRWVSFFNIEAEQALRTYLSTRKDLTQESKLFPISNFPIAIMFKKIEKETGICITPQMLREWFACEMGRLGIADRYVDAFCGRVPKSVLARHYTDFSPERLKEIYDKANLKVLS
jgi:integrase